MDQEVFTKDVPQQQTGTIITEEVKKETSNMLIIGDPKSYYHTQRNNKLMPSVTCFPTSVANVIDYELGLKGKKQSDIGIPDTTQIEDFLTDMMQKPSMINWMLKFVGRWTTDYVQRSWTVAAVEQKGFDDLMNNLGFDSTYTEGITYEKLTEILSTTQLPQVMMGDFRKTSSVGGHITCAVGFNKEKQTLYVNDPWGYAYSGYKDFNGCMREYVWSDFYVRGKLKDGTPTCNVLVMTRK